MSIKALKTSNNSRLWHSLDDDVESLLYVILYCSAMWLDDHESTTELKDWIESFFLSPLPADP